jgi:hypothetical protein
MKTKRFYRGLPLPAGVIRSEVGRGFYVTIVRKGVRHRKFFGDGAHSGDLVAYVCAVRQSAKSRRRSERVS